MAQEDHLVETERSRPRRRADRASRDRAMVHAILDQALVCHVAFVEDGAPVVIPATPWRRDGWLYLHGAAKSRLIAHVASGAEVCVSVAMVDGLVFARSAMRHSTDYRSVVLFGRGEPVADRSEKRRALLDLIDKLSPGRSAVVRPPDDDELEATAVVRLAIGEGSAKIRSAPPAGSDRDAGWAVWAGTVPLALRAEAPQPVDGVGTLAAPGLPRWLAPE